MSRIQLEAVSKPVVVASCRQEGPAEVFGGKMPPLRKPILKLLLALFVGISTILSGSVWAQPGGNSRSGQGGGRGPGGDLPKVGSTIPDITLYDDAGEEFSTSSLRGQYSVLVFGCLT